MKNKKYIVGFIFAAALSLAACGANNTSVSDSEVTVEASVSDETSVSEEIKDTEVKEETSVSSEASNTSEKKDEPEEIPGITYIDGVPSLRDCVDMKMGCRVGCAVTGSEIDDVQVWQIITNHFNAVTLGNELKPDALVGYSCTKPAKLETVEFNGEQMVVPVLDYSRANKILNKIYNWNEANPDRKIEVRGHVLVWHSQTPEWFFHVDYDKNKDYVSKEEMNKRLEWYIKTVLTYYTGEDSKYKDLFYGWDVVNEAVNDRDGGIRTDHENDESLLEDRHGSNSSWYHIYGDDEFIINAFKYANKYAPADLELYYNDYNETGITKKNGIIKLLQHIKSEEGEPGIGTRIDGMGMQGHYGMDSPDFNSIEVSIKEYAKVVGNVQITELDVSASSDYDGSAEKKDDENAKLKKRYNMIYYGIKSAAANPDVNVTGITFWGTVDHYSWLQSRSNVGGGNKTGLPQMPLLFDENYQPKPCFDVFANVK